MKESAEPEDVMLTRSCGHTESFAALQPLPAGVQGACPSKRKYRWRAQLRQASKLPCSHCAATRVRLPDRATFHATYDAATMTWTGSLTVDGSVHHGTSGGVHRLLEVLGNEYFDTKSPGPTRVEIAAAPAAPPPAVKTAQPKTAKKATAAEPPRRRIVTAKRSSEQPAPDSGGSVM